MDDGYDDGREEETHRERAGDREHRSDRDTGKKSSDKESKEEATQEIRTLIDNHQVGGIIGKGGSNVKKVRDETGAFVSILKAEFRNVQERIMVLKGTSTQIAKGCRLLADLLMDVAHQKEKKENSDSLSDTIAIRFLVHHSAVGAVIGKAGAVIKETQSDSGARVQVSNEPLPQSTEKTVTITGTPAQIEHAALRILTQLRDNPIRSGTKVVPVCSGSTPLRSASFLCSSTLRTTSFISLGFSLCSHLHCSSFQLFSTTQYSKDCNSYRMRWLCNWERWKCHP